MLPINVCDIPKCSLGWEALRLGIDPAKLPVREVKQEDISAEMDAVLSWRWDRDPDRGTLTQPPKIRPVRC